MPPDLQIDLETPTVLRHLRAPYGDAAAPLTEILRHREIPLNTRCGARGLCHGCSVDLVQGKLRHRLTSEIVLKIGDRLLGCATAAGPAFEGAALSCGMRAGDGAISRIAIEGDPPSFVTEQIGEGRPDGICGSAYIDFLAEGRRAGILSASGRYQDRAAAAHLVFEDDQRLHFRVAAGRGRQPIGITERDISRLLQAKASIAAGILTLLERVGIEPSTIRTLYLAGGFGLHLNVPNAISSGLLPGFVPKQVSVIGNSSLGGAYLALLDSGILDEMERVQARMELLELNQEPGFEDRYLDQLFLP